MIKAWTNLLFPNDLDVLDKGLEELEQLSKQEL